MNQLVAFLLKLVLKTIVTAYLLQEVGANVVEDQGVEGVILLVDNDDGMWDIEFGSEHAAFAQQDGIFATI